MTEPTGKRLDPATRKEAILAVAVARAEACGLNGLRRDDIAEHAGVANGLVTRYFNTMTQLRRAVIRHAVKNELLPLIAQALAAREPEALKANEDLKKRALASLQ
jgi:AcrR family transcriptional regulator